MWYFKIWHVQLLGAKKVHIFSKAMFIFLRRISLCLHYKSSSSDVCTIETSFYSFQDFMKNLFFKQKRFWNWKLKLSFLNPFLDSPPSFFLSLWLLLKAKIDSLSSAIKLMCLWVLGFKICSVTRLTSYLLPWHCAIFMAFCQMKECNTCNRLLFLWRHGQDESMHSLKKLQLGLAKWALISYLCNFWNHI